MLCITANVLDHVELTAYGARYIWMVLQQVSIYTCSRKTGVSFLLAGCQENDCHTFNTNINSKKQRQHSDTWCGADACASRNARCLMARNPDVPRTGGSGSPSDFPLQFVIKLVPGAY